VKSPTCGRQRLSFLLLSCATVALGLLIATSIGALVGSFLWGVVAGLCAGVAFMIAGVAVMLLSGGSQAIDFLRYNCRRM
jgi:hypothetical protein